MCHIASHLVLVALLDHLHGNLALAEAADVGTACIIADFFIERLPVIGFLNGYFDGSFGGGLFFQFNRVGEPTIQPATSTAR